MDHIREEFRKNRHKTWYLLIEKMESLKIEYLTSYLPQVEANANQTTGWKMSIMSSPAYPTAFWNLEHNFQARIHTPRECLSLPNDLSEGISPNTQTWASTYWQVGKRKVNSWGGESSVWCLLTCCVTHIWSFWSFIYKLNKRKLCTRSSQRQAPWRVATTHSTCSSTGMRQASLLWLTFYTQKQCILILGSV